MESTTIGTFGIVKRSTRRIRLVNNKHRVFNVKWFKKFITREGHSAGPTYQENKFQVSQPLLVTSEKISL